MMISISFPIVFVIISVIIFSQNTLSIDQYEEASVGTKIREKQDPIKTFQNQYGDTYDCVNIYKQFSLTHPLLKNHKIQMRPSSIPKKMFSKDDSSAKSAKTTRRSTSTTNKNLDIIEEGPEELSKNTCPRGTVPIRRSLTQQKKEDLINPPPNFNQKDLSADTSIFAGITTKGIPTKNYRAAYGRLSLYNPNVTSDQMSGVVISIQSGGDRAFLNKVETGWMVNPSLYGDTNTRLYTSWTVDDIFQCYNTKCPGFIVTSRETPVDLVFNQTTVGESQQYQIDLEIYQDKDSGNWWMGYGVPMKNIGYWPKEILPRLGNGAQVVQIGGVVSSSSYESKPPMGSGLNFLTRPFNYLDFAFFAQIQFNNDDGKPFPGDNAFIDTILNRCYKVTDNSYKDYTITGYDFVLGYSFVFGGQGGDEVRCQLVDA